MDLLPFLLTQGQDRITMLQVLLRTDPPPDGLRALLNQNEVIGELLAEAIQRQGARRSIVALRSVYMRRLEDEAEMLRRARQPRIGRRIAHHSATNAAFMAILCLRAAARYGAATEGTVDAILSRLDAMIPGRPLPTLVPNP